MTTNKNYFCIVIKSLIDSIIVYRRKQNNCDKYEMLARNFSNGNINWNEGTKCIFLICIHQCTIIRNYGNETDDVKYILKVTVR